MSSHLKDIRQKRQISQVQLANRLAVSNRTISHYETGKRTPSLATIKKLAIALHCKPTDLYPDLAG